MNLDKWNSLPKGLQDAFDAVAEDAVKEASDIWQYNMKHGMDFASASPGGHEFIYFSDDEVDKLKEMLKPVRGQYVDELNSKGLPGEDIANDAAKIMDKYN
jgi:TRAP-type C4-dicarboxylate transport system substrate-binding protein